LRGSPTEVPNVALVRTVIEMIEVEDQQRRRAMIDLAIPTDVEQTVTRPRMIAGLKEYVPTTSPLNSVTYHVNAV
jgi:hypothetical protein